MSQLLDETKRKHVMVKGETQGIGLAIARGFAQAGWTVTVAGIGRELEHQPTESLSFVDLDVIDSTAVDSLLEQTDS
ncbi:MAG: SDR family NAD(P)-dependent oxidoreductase [Pirellulaceae bacterium]|nr:SDR family NAD(P)-dependent oxidoreductase [Pirellulaceae bacterium]